MSQLNRCPECGAELPSGALGGLCPKCLLAAGLESRAELGNAVGGSGAPTTPHSAGFTPPDVASLAAHFPQLEILELLGHGGMGAVYKARQPKLDRVVALKIIRPESADDPAFAERFNREARMLARLNHPHIVAVYDFGSVNISLREMRPHAEVEGYSAPRPLYYFLMEYIEGMNLRQLLQAGELLPQQALAIVPQICEALQFAHDEGIVHRDIKPENILLDKRGRVKIADFGLAKLAAGSPEEFTLTGTHQVMGTPRYMAPEQMQGSHEVDHRADIYSLGVVFYEMLTGEVPMGHFDPPSKRVEIDVRLDEVVLRTLAREPERRYQHASDVKTDVNSIITPTGPAPSIKPSIVAWPYWRPSWQAYAAYSMVFALLLHSLVAAVYGNSVLWNNTVVLATLATILATSCLAYLIEKLRFDVRKSWRDPQNLLTLVLGFVMMLVTVLLPSPVELRDWLPSTTESFTERDERYLRILALGLSLWTFYFTAAHVWFALGWLLRRPKNISPKSGEPKTNAEFRPRGVSGETEQTEASAVANSGSAAAEPYSNVLRIVQNPAWGLIITGIISWVTIPLAFWIPILQDLNATQRTIFQITFGAIPLVVGTITALAGYRMRRLEGYRLAMFAAVLPIAVLLFKLVGLSFGTLGINPADWVGAPIGLWVLVVLTRSDVKAAFHRESPEQVAVPRTARGTLGRAWDEWWAERDRWFTRTALTLLLAVHVVCLGMFLALRGGGGFDSGRPSAWHHVGWPTPWFIYERGVEPNVDFRRTTNLLSSSTLIAGIGMLAWYAFWRVQLVRDARNARLWRTIGSPTAVLIAWIISGVVFAWLGVRDANRFYESMRTQTAPMESQLGAEAPGS